jgi:thymidylate synthase
MNEGKKRKERKEKKVGNARSRQFETIRDNNRRQLVKKRAIFIYSLAQEFQKFQKCPTNILLSAVYCCPLLTLSLPVFEIKGNVIYS